MTHPAFSNGDNRWLPGYCVHSESSKSVFMNFSDLLVPTHLHIECQHLGSHNHTGQVLCYQQCYAPVVFGPAALRYSVDFPFIPPQYTGLVGTTLQEDSMYNCSGMSGDETCSKCKREKRERLTREVCDLVSKHGCLEVTGKELLGWYMMLSEEDRKIIKESGHVTEFLQDNAALLVDNNWVMLKDGNMEDNAVRAHVLKRSGGESFYCGNCCSNSFTVSTCAWCHAAMKELEQSTLSDCELKNMDTTESLNNSPKYNVEQYDKDKAAVYHEGKLDSRVGEQYSGFQSLEKKHVSKVSPEGSTFYGSTNVMGDTWEQMLQEDTATEFISAVEFSDLTLEHLEGKSFNAPGKQVFRASAVDPGDLNSFEDSGISGDQMYASSEWFSENRKCVKAGEQGENHCMQGQKWDGGLCEETVNQSAASDLLDDTFFSIRSGSCCSLFSSVCSFDDLVDTEHGYFEEAVENLYYDALNNQSNQPQDSLCTSTGIQQQNTTIYPSVEARHRMTSKAVSTDATTVEVPGLRKSRTKATRDSACNTDLSLLSEFRHEKESQTLKVNTEDISIITDISVPKHLPLTLTIVNSEVTGSRKEACEGLGEDPHSQSMNAGTPTDGSSEPLDMQCCLSQKDCWENHQQEVEQQCCLGMKEAPEKKPEKKLTFKTLSALTELEEKYERMKALILSGVHLDTLNPLQLPDINNLDVSSEQEASNSLMGSQHHINQKGSEDILADHSKDLADSHLPAEPKDEPEREAEQPEFLPGKPSNHYVCVRNIAHSITEAELTSHFQKYKVSCVFFQELCQKSSYAILKFITLEDAQSAVLEMNGKELCGRVLKVNYIKDSKRSAYHKLDQLSGTQPHNATLSESVESEAARFLLCSKKCGSVPTEQAPATHSATHVSGFNKTEVFSSNAQMMEGFGPPMYPMHKPPAVPSWGSPSFVPLMPPWMVQSVLSNWMVCNSMHNQGTIPYSGPPYLLPTTSQSPWCPPSFPQSSNIIAKPGTNSYKNFHVTNVKSSTVFSFGRDGSMPSCTAKAKLVSEKSSLGLAPTILIGSEQANTVLPHTKSNLPGTNVPAIRETNKVTIVSTAAAPVVSFPSPCNIKMSQSTMVAADTDTPTLSTTPVIQATTARVTKSVDVGEEDHCTVAVPSKHSTTPLRAPTSFPSTVTIPQQAGSNPSGNVTSVFTTINTAASLFPAKTSVVISSTSPSSTAPQETLNVYTDDSERGGWGICPQLDPFTEQPIFIIPNRLNLTVFRKVIKELMKLHPGVPCDQIVTTLKDMQKQRGGYLSGFPIGDIVLMASSILATGPVPSKTTV